VHWSVHQSINMVIIPPVKQHTYVDNMECDNNPPPCEDVCSNTIGSYQCSCSDTSTSVTDDGRCIGIVYYLSSLQTDMHNIMFFTLDINECLIPEICQHNCTNIAGGYFCSCHQGYRLINGHNCTGSNIV